MAAEFIGEKRQQIDVPQQNRYFIIMYVCTSTLQKSSILMRSGSYNFLSTRKFSASFKTNDMEVWWGDFRNDKPPLCVFPRWVTWVTLTKTYPTSTSVILLREKLLQIGAGIFFEKPLFDNVVVVLVSPYLLVKIAQLSNAMILLTQNSARCYFRVDHHFPPFLVPYQI